MANSAHVYTRPVPVKDYVPRARAVAAGQEVGGSSPSRKQCLKEEGKMKGTREGWGARAVQRLAHSLLVGGQTSQPLRKCVRRPTFAIRRRSKPTAVARRQPKAFASARPVQTQSARFSGPIPPALDLSLCLCSVFDVREGRQLSVVIPECV